MGDILIFHYQIILFRAHGAFKEISRMTNSTQNSEEGKIYNLILQERGFGINTETGAATVVADQSGQPLSLRIAILPNGAIGGELVVPQLDTVREKSKSYINKSPVIYEISIKRKGCLGNFSIKAINAQTFAEEFQTGAFLVNESGEVRYLGNDGGCPEFLENALFAAFERSKEACPSRLFFGNIATDGRPIERQWRKKV